MNTFSWGINFGKNFFPFFLDFFETLVNDTPLEKNSKGSKDEKLKRKDFLKKLCKESTGY